VANNNDGKAAEPGGTADYCRIIGKPSIAVDLNELVKQSFDKIERVWTIRVPG
jgi:hypothetical protein